MNKFIGLLLSLILLLSNTSGGGGGDESPPAYQEDPATTQLKKTLAQRTQKMTDIPYEDWVSRFTVPEQPLTGQAVSRISGLMDEGYEPKGYEDYLQRFTPEESALHTGALEKYQSLFDTEDYGMEDYSGIEQDYLDTVLKKYGEAREEAWEPLRERYIGENLFESGPGFQAEREFGEETATGVGDITKQWAYEGIKRQRQEKTYQDALKRGDYSTMYQLAMSETEREMKPVHEATQASDIERKYQDAIKRGDIETAMNIGQLLKQSQLYPIEQATQAEFGGLQSGMGLFGQMQGADLAKYNAAMQAYKAEQAQGGDFGGLGTLLGGGAGLAAGLMLAPATGGLSLAASLAYPTIGAGLGAVGGGAAGSLFRH